jgi:hypothetical protein
MKWTNPKKRELAPEGYQDDTGFHYGKPPLFVGDDDHAPPDVDRGGFKHPFPHVPTIEEQTEPMVACAYCRKMITMHDGLIIGINHFCRLHCYVLWENKKERPVRQAKLFKKTLL